MQQASSSMAPAAAARDELAAAHVGRWGSRAPLLAAAERDVAPLDASLDAALDFAEAADALLWTSYYGQSARRALETMAARLSSKPHNRWMRRKWFRSAGGFAQAYDAATATVGQDADLWQKRHRHEPGKEGVPWETALGPRKWPQAFVEPDQNSNFHVMESDNKLDFTPTTDGVWQHDESSGFSLDFTTTADCRGAGLATEGKAYMPPLSITGHHDNFKYLAFPLPASSCQLMDIDGPQTTSSRPFTYAPPTPHSNHNCPHRTCQLTPCGAVRVRIAGLWRAK